MFMTTIELCHKFLTVLTEVLQADYALLFGVLYWRLPSLALYEVFELLNSWNPLTLWIYLFSWINNVDDKFYAKVYTNENEHDGEAYYV